MATHSHNDHLQTYQGLVEFFFVSGFFQRLEDLVLVLDEELAKEVGEMLGIL